MIGEQEVVEVVEVLEVVEVVEVVEVGIFDQRVLRANAL